MLNILTDLDAQYLIPRCRKFGDVMNNIYNAIVNLPGPIRRVCYVQVFAFMGWQAIFIFSCCISV